jgi:hypothetical protein
MGWNHPEGLRVRATKAAYSRLSKPNGQAHRAENGDDAEHHQALGHDVVSLKGDLHALNIGGKASFMQSFSHG